MALWTLEHTCLPVAFSHSSADPDANGDDVANEADETPHGRRVTVDSKSQGQVMEDNQVQILPASDDNHRVCTVEVKYRFCRRQHGLKISRKQMTFVAHLFQVCIYIFLSVLNVLCYRIVVVDIV